MLIILGVYLWTGRVNHIEYIKKDVDLRNSESKDLSKKTELIKEGTGDKEHPFSVHYSTDVIINQYLNSLQSTKLDYDPEGEWRHTISLFGRSFCSKNTL